ADSQLLVASSAITEDVYRAFVNKNASPRLLMWLSRAAVVVVAVVAALVALYGDRSVMGLVGLELAGLCAGCGPVHFVGTSWCWSVTRGPVSGRASSRSC